MKHMMINSICSKRKHKFYLNNRYVRDYIQHGCAVLFPFIFFIESKKILFYYMLCFVMTVLNGLKIEIEYFLNILINLSRVGQEN